MYHENNSVRPAESLPLLTLMFFFPPYAFFLPFRITITWPSENPRARTYAGHSFRKVISFLSCGVSRVGERNVASRIRLPRREPPRTRNTLRHPSSRNYRLEPGCEKVEEKTSKRAHRRAGKKLPLIIVDTRKIREKYCRLPQRRGDEKIISSI